MTPQPTASEWFLKAERAYSEKHQGCAWCGGAHRVHLLRQGAKHIYCCQHCDFQVSYDVATRKFHLVPGEEMTPVSETMLEQPLANLS